MSRFPCPYVKGEVELTAERDRHIAARHPDLLPEHRDRVAETLVDPDRFIAQLPVLRRYLQDFGRRTYQGVVVAEADWARLEER